ncbi:hypothetical protein [Actinoplanes sp. N902-109]|uniref:hypothetical protein n=1 Tax=Actinoplanes sp. (strain N902-109) TaxID=649831 RepID=UPI000329350E|nr:hypothetical protein [Actinoplanes sp. N902-109]AGL20088.1 putative membrane protein [Actinoplanes sp. N902-109]
MTNYLISIGILALTLTTALGTHEFSGKRLLRPLLIVAGVAALYLHSFPTAGNDVPLVLSFVGLGLILGIGSGLLVRVHRDTSTGKILTTAGAGFAALWTAVTAGRVLFIYGANHWFAEGIATFSRDHLITGADAWTAAFVLLALTMVVSRLAVTAIAASRARRPELSWTMAR